MSWLKDIFDTATGGAGSLAEVVVSTATKYFPPSMSDKEKADMQMALQNVAFAHEEKVLAAIAEGEKELTNRIALLEGTAADLKAIPFFGPIMLFLRGAQRPLIGYATIYLDFAVFSGLWQIKTDVQNSAFYIINLLVLGFLFGERAVRNVMPVIQNMMAKKVQ